jgi:hypothetical protein
MSSYYRSILNSQAVAAFAPTNISGCQLWLDAADDTTISIGTGVSQWNDKSGNERHLTQSTGANQPAYSLAAVNGLNAISFDGTNDYMDSGAFTINAPHTIVFAEKIDGTDNTQVLFDQISGNNIAIYVFSSPDFRATAGGSDIPVGLFDGNTKAHYLAIDGDAGYYTRNNESKITNNWGSPSLTSFRIGANNALTTGAFMNGFALEAIIYNKKLSDTELTQVQTYLSNKWAI